MRHFRSIGVVRMENDSGEVVMVNSQYLKSFIAEHDRKLDAKIEATALAGRLGVNYRHAVGDGVFSPLSPKSYQNILGRQYSNKTVSPTWPMRYEIVPRN